MEVKQLLYYMFYLVAFTSIIPMSWTRDGETSHIGEYDEYWRQKEAEAKKSAVEAYHPNPEEVNQHLNLHVHLALQGGNRTRRGLRTNKGKCLATNPIDRCWRCNPGWAKQRKKMAKCVLGFGRKTIGGRNGKIYIVTDSSDNDLVNPKPGTLRYAVTRKEPLWIIFKTDMVIRLNEELIISSFKTIDARGANVHIAHGAGLTIQFAKHVIIHGIHVHDIVQANGGMIRDSADHFGFRTASDGDAISIFGSTHVWIDHISMSNCKDGLIDIIQGSTAITLSNNHMTDHNEVMLFGASDSYTQDKMMQVTVAFNHFGRGLVQRMPRCRFGFIHVVNNDYTHWLMYAIGGSSGPTIISQGNRYIAPHNDIAKEVTKRDYASESEWKHWTWRSEHDLMKNGAFFRESGDRKNAKKFSKQDMIQAKSGSFVTRLTRYAGSLNCVIGKEC